MIFSIGAAVRERLSSPLRSLTSRLIISVFSAALVSSLVVSWTSTRSAETCLRSNIEEQFPKLLHTARQRLGLWYAQRELDIATFAASETVAALASRPHEHTRAAADRYLRYVLDAFPQYTALFLRRSNGEVVLWSGPKVAFDGHSLERLSSEHGTGTMALHATDGALFQIVSAPVESKDGTQGFLHGLVSRDALQALATELELGGSRRLFILDDANQLVLQTGEGVPTGIEPPSQATGIRLADSLSEDGRRVVGSALAFERFGWTLVVEDDYAVVFEPVVLAQREVLSLNLAIVALFGLLAYRIARSVSKPILALSHEAQRIAEGESKIELPEESGLTEIRALASALNEMMRRVAQKQAEANDANDHLVIRNSELSHANEMLAQLSITDGLTRLHNHRHFQERMTLETRSAVRSNSPMSLLLIDIDHFKTVNERFGYDVGDQVLRKVAMTIHNLSRETDLPARYGDEEFAVLAPHTHLEGAVDLAERIRMGVHKTTHRFRLEGEPHELSITVSVGCATLDGANPKRLFNDADSALYAAKSGGRDCVMTPPELL